MHGHYLLKLTASLARVRKTPLYFIIFVQKFCTLLMCVISAYGHEVLSICHRGVRNVAVISYACPVIPV